MPRVSEMIDSKYLRKEDVREDTVVTIRKFGQVNVAMDDQPEELKWAVKFDEFKKVMVLNSTNIQTLQKALGSDDTDHWIGQKIILWVDENVQFQGKLIGGLRFRRRGAPSAIATMGDPHAATTPPNKPQTPSLAERGGGSFADMDDDIPF